MKNKLLIFAGAVALLAVAGHYFAKPLLAQVRAAIVSNMDDPGRVAYQSINSQGCGSNICRFTFGPVPAHHRLVVQRLSLFLFFTTATAPSYLQFVVESPPASPGFVMGLAPAPVSAGLNAFDVPVQFYMDEGQSFQVVVEDSGPSIGFSHVTAVGYMLDCSAAPCSPIAQ